jgi:TolB-like protein/class 3 adenylate cyclase/Tfp pilus assembly protein PilF
MPGRPSSRDTPVSRRLAAVAFADVVGYSILMAQDETRTYRRWMAIRTDVIRPQAEKQGGTVIKAMGDGILVEFPSAFAAVAWARDVQRSISPAGDAHDAASPPVALRIAVHVGDVITSEDDIYGDGINVAARLHEHAPPGGIVLSEAVYELVRGSIDAPTRDLGLLELKNFEKLVRAYVLDPEVPGLTVPLPPQREKLPSIAVLPLENFGGDPADNYFCDGVVEDITLSLAGLREIVVIARGSALAFRGRQPDPREVGRALGVRYVLMGNLRKSERRVRVWVELCDASTGASLWSERAEVAPGELFDVQDRIVERIVAGIAPNVRAAELRSAMRKKPENFSAYDCTLRALHIINSLDVTTFPQARDYLDKAMAEDPNFAMPVAWAARWYSLYIGQGWSANPSEDAAKAVELATRAIDLDRDNALALATYGHLRSYLYHDYDSALVYFERALAACPNLSLAWILSCGTLSYVGRTEEAIRRGQQGLRLSPFDQSLFYYYMFLNLAHYAHGDYAEAMKWARMSASENPTYTANHRIMIADLAALGRIEEARKVATDMMKLEPDFRISAYERTRQPFQHPQIKARYMEHLRLAGLPE